MPALPLPLLRRPLPHWLASLLFALFVTLACNTAFFSASWHVVSGSLSFKLAFFSASFVLLLLFYNLLATLLLWPRIGKPVLIGLLLLAAVVAYFMNTYGVMIDRNMVRNVFQTDVREAGELLSLRMVLYIVLLGVLPGWLLWQAEIAHPRLARALLHKALTIVLTLLLGAALIIGFYQSYASFVRNNKEIRYLINPANAIYASSRYLIGEKVKKDVVAAPYGRDAHKGPALATATGAGKKALFVIVVGETARAESFGLNGYPRDTTPELRRLDVVNFSNASSCGTETAVSVPCMFSGYTRSDFDVSRAGERENLIDILHTAGMRVIWLDNNAGSKGVAKRVGEESLPPGDAKRANCRADECYDMALLDGLAERLAKDPQDTVLVLHQKGNHGPSYYLRVPPEFEIDKPVCRSNQLQDCPREEIINAYDNAIRYNDHFLASTIRLLQQQPAYDSALWYMSDHGESTGEKGLFLHATPYLIAPSQQTHIPMVAWFSQGFSQRFGLDEGCVKAGSSKPVSHDNLFHSTLGLLDIRSTVYDAGLDAFRGCIKRPG
ncbi:phosphoethanolamine transferase [Chitinilyticum aquatile]|uniref:phosphoethanolamine transferase n=1 Tax=Chitinilyticum aquatile TaxID=362520 RepID=UPI0003FE47D9|nr:phosphoethanolamine--lipid A transferase [Chitinilyticum aquatile]